MQDHLQLEGQYADPDLMPTRNPARIPSRMVEHTAHALQKLRWSRGDIVEFLGRYLTEPKANVVFGRPSRPLRQADFARRVTQRGARLVAASRMLFHGSRVFINGKRLRPAMRRARADKLADARELELRSNCPGTWQFLYAWYLAGYMRLASRRSHDE